MNLIKNKVSVIFIASRVLNAPLESLFTLLIFIIVKELNADYWPITLLACSKPTVSLLAFCMNSMILGHSQTIKNYLLALNTIGCLPCLLFPFMDNTWFFVGSSIIFMTSLRAMYPAWIEMLKNDLSLVEMRKIIAKGTSIQYVMMIFIPLLLSYWMDQNSSLWRFLFFILKKASDYLTFN